MKSRRIGEYLAERIHGGRAVVEEALCSQVALATDGTGVPLGQLLIESGHADRAAVNDCLTLQRQDILASVQLFRTLSQEWVRRIAEVSRQISLPAETVVFRQHGPGDGFYVLVTGSVRVYRESEHGPETTLSVLGPGKTFGEIALLTGEPRSASVITVEASQLLVVPRKNFEELLSAVPELSKTFVRILAEWLSHGDRTIEAASATERDYQQFVSAHLRPIPSRLSGKSREFTGLLARIRQLAEGDRPVLVTGEPGTEKLEAASLIHRFSTRRGKPFLWIDARSIVLDGMEQGPTLQDRVRQELAQCSALFGRSREALPFAPASRLGLLRVGDGGTVVIHNTEDLAPGVQKHLGRYLATGTYHPLGAEEPESSSVRIVMTSSLGPDLYAEAESIHPTLKTFPESDVLWIPPLRSRKKDIRHLVGTMLQSLGREFGKKVEGLSEEAYQAIMAYDWPGNTDELEVVIRRGVSIAEHDHLWPQDIFLAQPPVTSRYTFNLLKLEPVRKFFLQGTFAARAQIVTGLFIVAVVASGFLGSENPSRNVAPVLTWGVWEPLLVLSCFGLARMWCSVCPLRGLSRTLQKLGTLEKNVPGIVRRYGYLVAAGGIGLIFWAESAFHMLQSPVATAVLITVILIYALSVASLYKRMAWCRYLCPLGAMVGLISRCSAIELRSNYNICCSDCAQPVCFTGNASGEGCPMFEGPFSVRDNQDCTLCGNCIRVCERNSPVLNLRIPGQELWAIRKPDRRVVALGLVLMGSQVFRALEDSGAFSSLVTSEFWKPASALLVILYTLLMALLAGLWGSRLFKNPGTGHTEAMGFMVYGLIPLAATFELAWHLARFLSLGGTLGRVTSEQLDLRFVLPSYQASETFIGFSSVLILLCGMVWSRVVLTRLWGAHGTSAQRRELPPWGKWPGLVLGILLIWLIY